MASRRKKRRWIQSGAIGGSDHGRWGGSGSPRGNPPEGKEGEGAEGVEVVEDVESLDVEDVETSGQLGALGEHSQINI